MGLLGVLQALAERMTRSLHSEPYSRLLAVLIEGRHAKGLTQQIVADRLGRPQSYIAKIEGGERRLDLIEFIALARALETEPAALFAQILAAVEKAD